MQRNAVTLVKRPALLPRGNKERQTRENTFFRFLENNEYSCKRKGARAVAHMQTFGLVPPLFSFNGPVKSIGHDIRLSVNLFVPSPQSFGDVKSSTVL